MSSVEMWRIYAAIEEHNGRAARAAAVQHVKSACAAAREVFAEDSARSAPKGGVRLRKREVAGPANLYLTFPRLKAVRQANRTSAALMRTSCHNCNERRHLAIRPIVSKFCPCC